ncbi:hypothetical protein CK203_100232 [Vitis vinifera]|uniref:Uncharacterized protein n=1 Tax=Vitis vinifera TaxID=29760 RepID=A0A438FIA8_VITVI|nr:hypothetical protein CK203_100232 [Vitis vinifera]
MVIVTFYLALQWCEVEEWILHPDLNALAGTIEWWFTYLTDVVLLDHGHSIQGRGNRRKWQLLMYFDFDQGFLDVYSDVLLKLILMIFLTGKVTFPSGELEEGEIPGC